MPIDITAENLPAYLVARGLANDAAGARVRELGGGVSNVVLLVEWPGEAARRWVVKQSLGKLRVEDDWRSSRRRILREADAIQTLGGAFGASSLPRVIDTDPENYLYVMTAAPAGSQTWKSLLLAGNVDLAIARQAAENLAVLVSAGSRARDLGERFADRTVFDELRIDPYYRTAAARHPELRAAYGALIEDSLGIRTALVHGDYSPKNMLVKDGSVCLIDFEVVHWGDPAFDAGFLLNHLFLKALYQPRYREQYFEAAGEFWRTLRRSAGCCNSREFEALTMRHLGGLMMARIDGKSPVEYITDESTKQRARELATRILLEPARTLGEAADMATAGSADLRI